MRIRLHSGRLGLGIQLACYAQRVLHGAPSAPHLSQQLFACSGVAMQPLLALAPKRREHAGARGRPIQLKRAARTGGRHREGASACARDAATTRQSMAHRAGSAFTSPTPLSAERYRSASSGAASLAASLPISAHAAPFARCSAKCAIARGRLRSGPDAHPGRNVGVERGACAVGAACANTLRRACRGDLGHQCNCDRAPCLVARVRPPRGCMPPEAMAPPTGGIAVRCQELQVREPAA